MDRIDPRLLKKYAEGRASEEECQKVENWLEEEDNLFEPHADFGGGREHTAMRTLAVMWNNFVGQTQEGVRYLRLWWWSTRVVAPLLLLLGIGTFISLYTPIESSQEIELLTVEVPKGQRAEIRLSDSTTVYLAGGSRFVYPKAFNSQERRLSLEYGHAFLKVAKDQSKPFILQSDGVQIKVLGTAFDVANSIGAKDIAVILKEGSVAFSDKKGLNQVMKPGDKLVYHKNNGHITYYEGRDVSQLESWTAGRLEFHTAHLSEVLFLLSERFNKTFQFGHDIGTIPVTGSFSGMPLSRILYLLSESTGLEFTEKNNTITIKR